jgi:hypothetical protein
VSTYPFALSIVIPVNNGAESVPELVEALSRLESARRLRDRSGEWWQPRQFSSRLPRIMRASHGSTDRSESDTQFRRTQRRHGWLRSSSWRLCNTIDDDLQNPPEEVVRLWRYTLHGNFDAVYTYYSHKEKEKPAALFTGEERE